MAMIRKTFTENGIIVGKEYKAPTEAKSFKNDKGEQVDIMARGSRYVLKVVSSGEIDEKGLGMITPSYGEIDVDSIFYNTINYLDKVKVVLEMTTSGTFKVIDCTK